MLGWVWLGALCQAIGAWTVHQALDQGWGRTDDGGAIIDVGEGLGLAKPAAHMAA